MQEISMLAGMQKARRCLGRRHGNVVTEDDDSDESGNRSVSLRTDVLRIRGRKEFGRGVEVVAGGGIGSRRNWAVRASKGMLRKGVGSAPCRWYAASRR